MVKFYKILDIVFGIFVVDVFSIFLLLSPVRNMFKKWRKEIEKKGEPKQLEMKLIHTILIIGYNTFN